MATFSRLSLVVVLGVSAVVAAAACGDDETNVVRTRDGGGAETGAEAGPNTLACGVMVSATYDSPSFAANAKEALDLKLHFQELQDKMKTAEGAGTAAVTGAELDAIFKASTPSLYTVATAATQATVGGYLSAFGDAAPSGGKTWSPADAEAEAGVTTGE